MFTHEERQKYDLESLWGVGYEFESEEENVVEDNMVLIEDLMSRKNSLLADIEPLEEESSGLYSHFERNKR